MEKIEEEINRKKIVCLFGYPGVGKTSYAAEFSYQQKEKYNVKIIWIEAENQTKILKKIIDLMKKIDNLETDLEKIKINFLCYVNNTPNTLLVFDNLENLEDLTNLYKLESIKSSILITTRMERVSNLQMIKILPFTVHEATEYLKISLPYTTEECLNMVVDKYKVNEELLPCKLNLIVGLLNENKEMAIEEAFKECRTEAYIIKIIDSIKLEWKDCIKLLKIATLIDPDYISVQFLKKFKLIKPLNESLQKLSNFNLLTRVNANSPKYGIKMHRIFIKDFKQYFELPESDFKIETETVIEITEIINDSIGYTNNNPATHIKENNDVILHAINILKFNIKQNTLTSAKLYEKVGTYYQYEIQEYEKALQCLNKGLEIKSGIIKGNNSELATSFERMGCILSQIGNYLKAQHYHTQALQMRQELYSGNHPDIALSLNNLAVTYSNLGDNKKALEYTTKALQMRQELYSGNHPDIAQSLNDLAVHYGNSGDNKKDLEYTTKALQMRQELYSGNHPDIAQSLNDLAVTYSKLGDNKKALEYTTKALQMRQELFPGNHTDFDDDIQSVKNNQLANRNCRIT